MSVQYNPSIVTSNMVLCLDPANPKSYPGSGTTWFDLSGNGLDATLFNTPTYSNTHFTLNGTNQYATIPYTPTLAPTSQITVAAWARADNWQSTASTRIVSKTEGGGYQLSLNDIAGVTGATVHVNGTYRYATVNNSTISAGWHYIAFTFDGRFVRTYIDAVNVATVDVGSTLPLTYNNNNILVIGAEPVVTTIAGNYFPGSVGSVSVYNRGISASEIAQNFNALRGRYGI